MDAHHTSSPALAPRPAVCRGRALLAAAAGAALLATAAQPAHGATRSFRAIADAGVQQSKPHQRAGRSHQLVVGKGRLAYIRFNIAVPDSEQVVSARLRVSPELPVSVRLAGNGWSERRISWRNRPSAGRAVKAFRRTGVVTYVLSSSSSKAVRYASRESGHGPVLLVTTRSTATATSGPVADPSGEPAPLGNRAGWTQVFFDDFSVPAGFGQFPSLFSDKWWAYPTGWKDTSGYGVYDPARVLSVHDGVLDYHVRTEGGRHLVGAPVPRLPGTERGITSTPSGQTYGRYSVRYRSDSLRGYKVAWLLWPDSKQFPRDGEIDFPEGDLDGTQISGYVHRQGAEKSWDQAPFHAWASPNEWHTATTEWLPGRVTFYLDGQVVGQTRTRVPNTPMHWVLQTETNTEGRPVSASANGHVQVDWVAVWKPAAAAR
jgi:beta-glucanase (GH16 family)